MREKVLIPAFVRALKDPFPPGRSAALLSLTATQQYHSAADVASKVIPYIAPVALDPEASVRETALQSLRVYVGKLETASRNIGKPRDPNAAPGTGGAAAEDSALPPEVSEAASKVLSSMSWITGQLKSAAEKAGVPTGGKGDAAAPAGPPAAAAAAARAVRGRRRRRRRRRAEHGERRRDAYDDARVHPAQARGEGPVDAGARGAADELPAAGGPIGDGWGDDDLGLDDAFDAGAGRRRRCRRTTTSLL